VKRGSVWLSFVVLWGAYTLVYTGYVWIRGYDIGLLDLVSPVQFYQGSSLSAAGTVSGGQVLPAARAAGSASGGG